MSEKNREVINIDKEKLRDSIDAFIAERESNSARQKKLLSDTQFIDFLREILKNESKRLSGESLAYGHDSVPSEHPYDRHDVESFISAVIEYAADNYALNEEGETTVSLDDTSTVTAGIMYGPGTHMWLRRSNTNVANFSISQLQSGEILPGVTERREKVAKFGEYALALINDGIDPYELHSEIDARKYSTTQNNN